VSRRFALYFAPPPGSSLEAFGRRWLGRDHITGEPVDQPKIDGLEADELASITRSARHYGFHATLKAPFELAPDRRAEELCAHARAFAASREKFAAPALEITGISQWVACTLAAPSPAMDRLAADCVRDFEAFRAPSPAADIERRRAGGLTARQDHQLLAFGYPYIFEDFQFHMTLAGPLDDERRDEVLRLLRALAPPLGERLLVVDAIAIYEQSDRDQPFIQTARLPFGGRRSS
jgi:putative phosphonate metabolism protein